MPELSALLQAVPPPAGDAWSDTVVRYGFSALLGWAAASAHVGKKLQAHEKAMLDKMADIEKTNDARMAKMERDHALMSAELWGAQGDGGLRRAVEKVQNDVAALSTTTTEILMTVKQLAKGKPSLGDTQ